MSRRNIAVHLLLIGLLTVSGCAENMAAPTESQGSSEQEPDGVYQKITAVEAHQMMQEENGYILLDVRTQEEFDEAHIEGAVLIPDYEIADKADTKLPSKEALIFVYCRTGRRSAESAKQLLSMGYTNVYDFGGILDWPYDTVNTQTKEDN